MYTCDSCQLYSCYQGKPESYPKNCPCLEEEENERCKKLYDEPENKLLAYHSSRVEAEGYVRKNRLEEIMDFSRKCGFEKLGVAFCLGLKREARQFCRILRANGFQVVSVICKNGRIPKEFLGITDEQKVRPGTFESMCNPIGQAMRLNRAGTQLNIMLGLCVGHDSLFIKYSKAPVTVFAVKDRALAHNPLGAVYLSESYYRRKLFPEEEEK
jgi:uncharacterized metal-binding protein